MIERTVSSCAECPSFIEIHTPGVGECAEEGGRWGDYDPRGSIPDWCPLLKKGGQVLYTLRRGPSHD